MIRRPTEEDMGVAHHVEPGLHYKDLVLDELAELANVAQFASFGPGPPLPQRYSRIHGYSPNHQFASVEEALATLLDRAVERSVNIRSFHPAQPKAHEFIYGLKQVGDILGAIRRISAAGLYTIANETIDVHDGGVSGVAYGRTLEFAPDDTPRCVEKPGTVAFAQDLGVALLERVYGFPLSIDYPPEVRVEFSLHPLRRGFQLEHTIIWELERLGPAGLTPALIWPNRFSAFLGDKAFGLLVAHMIGLRVPATTVIPRRLPPFTFGKRTNNGDTWIRTAPTQPIPGRFTTQRGWRDPFNLLAQEDPEGVVIASVLAQEGVNAVYSGAVITDADGTPTIEGVRGSGEAFMLGRQAPQPLPPDALREVNGVFNQATALIGAVGFEWVYDGETAWVVQLHQGRTSTKARTIFPGKSRREHQFEVNGGLEALRSLIAQIKDTGDGIVLIGDIGITSHFGDVLRKSRIPSRIEPPAE